MARAKFTEVSVCTGKWWKTSSKSKWHFFWEIAVWVVGVVSTRGPADSPRSDGNMNPYQLGQTSRVILTGRFTRWRGWDFIQFLMLDWPHKGTASFQINKKGKKMGQILASSQGTKQTSSILCKYKATKRTGKKLRRNKRLLKWRGGGVGGDLETCYSEKESRWKERNGRDVKSMKREFGGRGTQRSLFGL